VEVVNFKREERENLMATAKQLFINSYRLGIKINAVKSDQYETSLKVKFRIQEETGISYTDFYDPFEFNTEWSHLSSFNATSLLQYVCDNYAGDQRAPACEGLSNKS
jgi:hypothetical protein